MQRMKSLVVGAKPPIEGPIVRLDEARTWRIVVRTHPSNAIIESFVRVRVGEDVYRMAELVSGSFAQVLLVEELDPGTSAPYVSVFLKEEILDEPLP